MSWFKMPKVIIASHYEDLIVSGWYIVFILLSVLSLISFIFTKCGCSILFTVLFLVIASIFVFKGEQVELYPRKSLD